MNFRTGFGFDVHRLESGMDFILGGIKITHSKGCVAHSDGDVLIHAICDALLGAANLRDIGHHFPDTDDSWKNADSKIILKKTIELVRDKNYEISNIDSTIVLQKPKVSKYIPEMQQTLSEVLGITTDQISIKATTSEKLGFEGREEGVSAYANVLIFKS
jgi:2-C-methyl-D-erythritol 2,4-cyclodiphosphate synthase